MKLLNVPYIDQTTAWPTGCESVSSAMLLQYLGYELSVDAFIGQYLEMAPLRERDGKLCGPNPRRHFAGSPYDAASFGCYAPVIETALNRVFAAMQPGGCRAADAAPQPAYRVVDLTGVSEDELCRAYIDRGLPVIYWASIDFLPTIPGPQWLIEDTGELFTWISNEHCLLLVGYDTDVFFFNDPWHNHGTIACSRALAKKRHAEQYSMALSVERL